MPESHPESTVTLIDKARSGDEGAKNTLVSRYLPRLTRWATGRLPAGLRSTRDTDDLVQDALIGALRNLDTFEWRNEGSFLFYLARAVTNRIHALYRSKQLRPERDELPDSLASREPSPLDVFLGKELREWYEQGLAALSEEEQLLIFLSVEQGYTHKEIAELLRKPSSDAARMAIKRAVEHLAAEMDGCVSRSSFLR